MKKLYLIALVFISSIAAMDENKIIEDYSGNRFTISHSTYNAVNLFQNTAEFSQEEPNQESPIDYVFSRKESALRYNDAIDQKSKFVDTISQPAFSFLQQKAGNIPLSSKILRKALECIEYPAYCKELEPHELRRILKVINYLQPKNNAEIELTFVT
jgi:hypothetical protein